VTAEELLAGLVEQLPEPERVEPWAYLDDDLLPLALAPVEPAAFVIACVQAAWGPRGLRN
jgi:hypothetical protein